LRKRYRMGNETVNALDGLDLDIEPGELLAIIGSSGSGKSTLMHVLGFMDRPSSGDMIFEGEQVADIPPSKRAALRSTRIGFVFQSFNLLPRLSVLGNVLLPVSYSRRSEGNRKERAEAALDRVGMAHRMRHQPSQLSGGERQRVAIARALINQPGLILADEPTGNLDSANVNRILQLFQELREEGNTMALVTHDDHVASFASRVIRMRDGNIIEEVRQ
jgi:putative ABC transport system ATP-binding protein